MEDVFGKRLSRTCTCRKVVASCHAFNPRFRSKPGLSVACQSRVVEGWRQLPENAVQFIIGRFHGVTLAKDRQGRGALLQHAIVVENGVSAMTQVSERITVHPQQSALLADLW